MGITGLKGYTIVTKLICPSVILRSKLMFMLSFLTFGQIPGNESTHIREFLSIYRRTAYVLFKYCLSTFTVLCT